MDELSTADMDGCIHLVVSVLTRFGWLVGGGRASVAGAMVQRPPPPPPLAAC